MSGMQHINFPAMILLRDPYSLIIDLIGQPPLLLAQLPCMILCDNKYVPHVSVRAYVGSLSDTHTKYPPLGGLETLLKGIQAVRNRSIAISPPLSSHSVVPQNHWPA